MRKKWLLNIRTGIEQRRWIDVKFIIALELGEWCECMRWVRAHPKQIWRRIGDCQTIRPKCHRPYGAFITSVSGNSIGPIAKALVLYFYHTASHENYSIRVLEIHFNFETIKNTFLVNFSRIWLVCWFRSRMSWKRSAVNEPVGIGAYRLKPLESVEQVFFRLHHYSTNNETTESIISFATKPYAASRHWLSFAAQCSFQFVRYNKFVLIIIKYP